MKVNPLSNKLITDDNKIVLVQIGKMLFELKYFMTIRDEKHLIKVIEDKRYSIKTLDMPFNVKE